MEAHKPLTMGAFEPAALVDWNGGHCNLARPDKAAAMLLTHGWFFQHFRREPF